MAERARQRQAVLLKRCPQCGGHAEAEAKLNLGGQIAPCVLDLDRPLELADRLGLSQLLALVEVIPYKQFVCTACGHGFKLANRTGKDMVLSMLASMQPVYPPGTEKKTTAAKRPAAASANVAGTAARDTPHDDWEPESLDH